MCLIFITRFSLENIITRFKNVLCVENVILYLKVLNVISFDAFIDIQWGLWQNSETKFATTKPQMFKQQKSEITYCDKIKIGYNILYNIVYFYLILSIQFIDNIFSI